MPQATLTLPDGREAVINGPTREAVINRARIVREEATIDGERVVQNAKAVAERPGQGIQNELQRRQKQLGILELAGRQFINNGLAIPSAIGEALAIGAAGIQTVAEQAGGNDQGFVEGFQENREEQRGQFPANKLIDIPRPTTGDLAAGVQAPVRAGINLAQGEAPNLSGEFAQGQLNQQGRVQSLKEQPGGTIGPILGDVATVATGRVPRVQALASKNKAKRETAEREAREQGPALPEEISDEFDDILTSKILPGLGGGATSIGRGLGRAGEATVESATLALLNDQDPFKAALFGGGQQLAGSLSLTALSKLNKGLVPAIALAAVTQQMFKETTPGGKDFILESTEGAITGGAAAIALGLISGVAGSGRLRGPLANRLPQLADAITTVPRVAVQNRLRELTSAEESGNSVPLRTLELMTQDPARFNENQLTALTRALSSDKAGAFTREVERLNKTKEFQAVLGAPDV